MNPHEIHSLSGAYAMDALDEAERARFEEHLAACAACRAEVASLRAATAVLSELSSTTPPPALRDRLLAEIKTVRPLPPQTPDERGDEVPPDEAPSAVPMTRRWRRPLHGLLIAAALLGVVGVGTVVWQQIHGAAPTLSAVDRVLTANDAEAVVVDLPGSARARVVRSESQGRAVIVTHDMPAAPPGRVYQLWLQDDSGTMLPAGLMPPGADQEVLLDGDATEATGVGITVEPAGGSPQPTSAPVALFDFAEAT